MNCVDIYEETYYVMGYMDSNGDGFINVGDEMDPAVAADIAEHCDLDGNG